MLRAFAAGILLLSIIGCVAQPPKEPFRREEPYPFREKAELYPLADDGNKEGLKAAIDQSLAFWERKRSGASPMPVLSEPFGELFTPEKIHRTLKLFREVLVRAAGPSDFEAQVFEKFVFVGRPDEGKGPPLLLTGYYEPVFEGSLKPQGEYRYPIYRRPDDLVEIQEEGPRSGRDGKRRIARMDNGTWVPYFSRQEIDGGGALNGKGYELAWMRDPWERFVLHVQGSGQIRLPDGRTLRCGFSASNGRPYRSIGQILVKQGYFPETDLSLRRVRDFLSAHPEKAGDILNQNERYVFFRAIPGGNGPFGSLGVPLTEGRSIASDPGIYPLGALAYLIARQPLIDGGGEFAGKAALRRFVLNQDTGAAMSGSGRIDLFCGTGEKAGLAAGQMRESGKIYFLAAK